MSTSHRLRVPAVAAFILTAFIVAACGGSPGTVDPAAGLTSIGAGIKGPEGLRASMYAKGLPGLAALAFDEQGRLWAATAAFEDTGSDALYVIDTEGATPVKVVADLHTPLGLLWYQQSLYVASASGVDAYSGFDGTHFADHRAIVTLPPNTGKPGMIVLGPDGRMRMGISAPCDSCVPSARLSGAVVSFQPDGSDVHVLASGIRAPVGLAYFPDTSDLFVTMNQRDDLGDNTPGDWLAVVHEGDAWGFPACYGQGGAPCAGVPAPVGVLDKHAAVSGIAIVTGQLGTRLGTAAIVAEWAVGKVQAVVLTKTAAGYSGAVVPFLTGLKSPVPVLLSSNGALFVGEWSQGTVYRITAP